MCVCCTIGHVAMSQIDMVDICLSIHLCFPPMLPVFTVDALLKAGVISWYAMRSFYDGSSRTKE